MTESSRSTFRKIRLIVLGEETELPLARAVLASLSRAQSYFQLSLDETPTPLAEDAALSPEQFVELVERRREDGDEMLFGITGHANTANFFGWKDTDALTAFCSRSGWPYLSNLPEQAFVAFQCAAYALRLSAPGLRLHDEMNGCVQDFCPDKAQFNFKLRTADICHACREVVEHVLEPERLDAIVAMLEQARRVALGRTDPDVVVRPVTLAERVDQSYPFPIAYSFRKMQVEADPTHRWRLLLDAADITLRYLAVVGMALTSEVGLDGHPRACTDAYRKLDKPSLGDWRSLALGMMKWLGEPGGMTTPVPRLQQLFAHQPRKRLANADKASQALVALRNSTHGHDHVRTPDAYEALIRQHQGLFDALLEGIAPLAELKLVKPLPGTLNFEDGETTCSVKVLSGSHHVFRTQPLRLQGSVETGCLLIDEETSTWVPLSPWVRYEVCPSCGHETASIFEDARDGRIRVREIGNYHDPRILDAKALTSRAQRYLQHTIRA